MHSILFEVLKAAIFWQEHEKEIIRHKKQVIKRTTGILRSLP